MDREIRRQLIHASGAIFSFIVIKIGIYPSIVMFSLFLVVGFLIAVGYKRGTRIPLVTDIVDLAERPEVVDVKPAKGALCFFLGSLLVLIIFRDVVVASAAIIILAFGDSFSTLAGKKIGRHRIIYNREKSVEGSIVGVVFAFAGALLFVPAKLAVLGAVVGMLAESLPLKVDDNISIPLFSGLIMYLAY
jgi:dolichol kinase